MAKKRTPDSKRSSTEAIQRREALKRLGALAITAPTLASVACLDDEDPQTGMSNNGAEAGPPGGGPGGTLDAGGGTTGGGTAGGGTQSGGTQGGGTQGGGTQGGGTQGGGGTTGGSTGGTAGGTGDAGVGSAVDAAAGDAGPGSTGFFPPMFQEAATCTLTPPDPATEGPFFIHEEEVMTDPTLVRVDCRDGHPGVELQLNLRLLNLNAEMTCATPIPDVEVYIWHTDAVGMYSGFNGQNPNETYRGGGERTVENADRFCRGVQVTNAQGVVSFRTLYPGWYYGRPIHIHFVALRRGSTPDNSGTDPSYRSAKYHMFTTQFYFEESFSRAIHENNAPYTTRTNHAGYPMYIGPGNGRARPTARMEGNVAVATMNIITRASESRGVGGAFGGFGGFISG